MLFARVNQPVPNGAQTSTQWEMWPSNDDTFSAAVPLFKAENKVRTRPHLQIPKKFRAAGGEVNAHALAAAASTPIQEEVTRNSLSYGYIIGKGLQSRAGVKQFLSATGAKVDLPIGAVEIKAAWTDSAVDGAYQFKTGTTTYSLLGLHIMAKIQATPADPFGSEDPSWFWTTFEFQGNEGLDNAQKFLTYHDQLPPPTAQALLGEAGLGSTAFKNYRCNGTQIRFSDAANPLILLGNTKMEDFNFAPDGTSPDKWTSWKVSCHTCHATAAGKVQGGNVAFYPFNIVNIGKIPAGQMAGYTSMDFIWSIPFRAH